MDDAFEWWGAAAVGAIAETFVSNLEDPVDWLHVTDPSEWKVVPTAAFVLADSGVVMRQTAEPTDLMRHTLTTSANTLNFQDLLQCARTADVDLAEGTATAKEACDIIGKSLDPTEGPDNATGDVIYKSFTSEEVRGSALDDALVEAVFEDLDAEDNNEFPEVAKAIKERKIRTRCAEYRLAKKRKLADRPKKKPKPKSKAKAKAKAMPGPGIPPEPDAGPPPPPGPAEPHEPAPPPVAVPAPAAPAPEAPEPPPPEREPPPPEPEPPPPPGPPPPAGAHHGHGPPVLPGLVYNTVPCARCGALNGQFQLHQSPGLRDKPSWKMRVIDPATRRWANRAPLFRVLTETAERNEVWVRRWLDENRTCCRH